MLQEQILLFLVVFGLLTLVIHAVMRSPSGRAALAVRSSEVAAEASGITVEPVEGHDVRPVGRHRRHRWRAARHVLVRVHRHDRAGAPRAHLARAGRDLRHPPSRRRAARRLRVRRRHRGLPLDLVVVVPQRRRRAGADHLDLLHPDPLGPRRDPARAGARRHPLARRASRSCARSARRRGSRASPRPRQPTHGGEVPEHERAARRPTARLPSARRIADRLSDDDVARRRRSRCAASSPATATPRCSTASTSRRAGQDHRAARRQRRRQVDALLGCRRHRRCLDRHGVPRGHGDHRRPTVPPRACAVSCSCPRRAASSPA